MFVTILSHCFVVYSAGWVRSLTAPGSVFVHRCISLPLKTPRQSHVAKSLATWVDEYGTGSGPGSPDGQPGWGGGSDRMQPAIHKPFNARGSQLSQRFALIIFNVYNGINHVTLSP